MDINLVIDALISYLRVWKVTYYISAKPHQNPDTESLVTANILRFKQILHANDAGLNIYEKNFGKIILGTLEYVAFGSYPSLNPETIADKETVNPVDKEECFSGDIVWEEDAKEYLKEAPFFVRKSIKDAAEKKSREAGSMVITKQFIDQLRK